MSDALWRQAKADLTVQLPGAPVDTVVWEHSERVARISEHISALPEVTSLPVDRAALSAAALYHDAGWILQVQEGAISSRDLLLRPTSDIQRELAADWLEQRAAGLLPSGSLLRAVKTIRQYSDRRTELPEARILCDADNLDQIGPQAICMMVRKLLCEGRNTAELIAAWERQEEYHYWQARIKECFHFDSIRELAERRYEAMRQCMSELATTALLADVAELVASPSDAPAGKGGRGRAAGGISQRFRGA